MHEIPKQQLWYVLLGWILDWAVTGIASLKRLIPLFALFVVVTNLVTFIVLLRNSDFLIRTNYRDAEVTVGLGFLEKPSSLFCLKPLVDHAPAVMSISSVQLNCKNKDHHVHIHKALPVPPICNSNYTLWQAHMFDVTFQTNRAKKSASSPFKATSI